MLSIFELPDEIGLYPYYPSTEISKLLITKNRKDANLLLEQKTIMVQYNILVLCGREGLSEEHMIALTVGYYH